VSLIFWIVLLSLILQLESSSDGFKGFSILIGQLFYAHLLVLGLNTLRYLCFVHPFFSGMAGLDRHHQPNWKKGLFLGQIEKWPAVSVSDCLVTLNLLFGLAVQEFLLWFEWQYSPLGLGCCLICQASLETGVEWVSLGENSMVATILIAYNFVFAICVNSYMQQSHPELQLVFTTITLFMTNTCLTLQTTNF
jgi:hypothetical protein